MNNKEIVKKVYDIAKNVVKKFDLDLFDVKYYNQSGKWILEIVIDNPNDYVSTIDCEKVSREIEFELDALDIIPKRYYLTVSSPGLDRPLRNIDDFKRFKNHKVKIVTFENKTIIGYISDVLEEKIIITLETGNNQNVEFKNIKKANLEIEF
ncbi:MAG: ribosome maturation factor RimP [Thermosipho sp. (in: thermotogales)]|nr:ribosome maturation factor RimP [Thermosipho sp. (in: thermotogales)]MDN5324588.1 ribosome maturation factor RimP [Thermosipho sp. (in: thermotogales)]